jgi:autotransporter-associated beta strand protein
LWTPTDYTIFIDGVNVRNWNYANNGVPVSRSTEWAILSSEVDDTSTTWAGTIPSGGYGSQAASPVKLTVDYVRYYAPTNTIFWTGAVSSDLANAGNYVSNRPPLATSDVTFSLLSGNNLFPAVNGNLTLDGLIFSWMNNGLTLGGIGTLTLGAGGMDMVAANHTVNISCPVNLGADQTWAVGLNNPGNTLNVNGPISGSATLTKSGWGTLVLNGANSFSGTLNVDTGSTGSGSQNLSDGIVRLTRSANVASVPLIAIRNNNAASSTLQLTNTVGDLVIPSAIMLNGRNTNVVAIENLSGSNTLAGGLTLNVGGGFYLLQSDGAGMLNLGGVISSAASGTRTITLQGNGDFYVSGSIQNGSASAIVLLKTNAGTLTIAGDCPFSGATTNYRGNLIVNGSLGSSLTVAGGTLAGNGAIGGATLIQAGATLAPGSGPTAGRGTLTFGNSLTLAAGSSSFFEINASAQTNDSVVAAGTLIYGGTLTVTNLGGSLAVGQRFKLFKAGSFGGSFTALNLPPLGTNLVWDTAALTNGELVVARGAVAPRVGQVSLTGTNLVFRGDGGAANDNYSVLASPDVAAPLTNWSVIGTGTFDVNGNFIFTNPVDFQSNGVMERFYRLLIP